MRKLLPTALGPVTMVREARFNSSSSNGPYEDNVNLMDSNEVTPNVTGAFKPNIDLAKNPTLWVEVVHYRVTRSTSFTVFTLSSLCSSLGVHVCYS
jgi:hypothetical protein